MHTIKAKSLSNKISIARQLIKSAGNKIGSVTFIKKDNSVRRMAYRLNCKNTSYARISNNHRNVKRNQMIVLDTNIVAHNKKGHIIGRGAWRTISLDNVKRIKVNGEVYRFA